MILRLHAGELTVGELAAPTNLSLAAISKHVKILERAGLVVREKAGSYQVCTLQPEPLELVQKWLER